MFLALQLINHNFFAIVKYQVLEPKYLVYPTQQLTYPLTFLHSLYIICIHGVSSDVVIFNSRRDPST